MTILNFSAGVLEIIAASDFRNGPSTIAPLSYSDTDKFTTKNRPELQALYGKRYNRGTQRAGDSSGSTAMHEMTTAIGSKRARSARHDTLDLLAKPALSSADA